MENTLKFQSFKRSSTGILGGVCKGLAQRFDVDVLWIRLGFLFSFFILGAGCGIYLLLLVSFPREDRLDRAYDARILGVCARLATRLNFDVGLTRAAMVFFLFATFGATFLLYIILFLYFQLEKRS